MSALLSYIFLRLIMSSCSNGMNVPGAKASKSVISGPGYFPGLLLNRIFWFSLTELQRSFNDLSNVSYRTGQIASNVAYCSEPLSWTYLPIKMWQP